jgi:hypothetical protein
MKFRFVADEPIDSNDLDDLGFAPFVDRIHAALADTATPFVYGLLGPWGSGKTSVQKLLATRFRKDLKDRNTDPWLYVPVWLDAWRYENQDNMIFPLLHAFRQSRTEELVGKSTSEDAGFLQGLRDVAAASAVAVLDLGLRAVTKKAFGEAMKLKDVKEHVEDVINRPDEIEQLLSTWVTQVEGLRHKYQSFIVNYAEEIATNMNVLAANVRFVVFVDDLDRCLPNVAVGVLESIKNHLAVSGCIYILGINPQVIQRGIRAKYAGLDISGREYLEKILNYSFVVPVPDRQALTGFGAKRLNDLLIDQQERDKHRAALEEFGAALSAHGFNNPRKIKRILNSYLLFLATEPSPGHFDMGYITRLIVLAEYYPELFRTADRGALGQARKVLGRKLTAVAFQDAYGYAIEPMLADFATMPGILEFPTQVQPGRADLDEHIETVRAVCGRT